MSQVIISSTFQSERKSVINPSVGVLTNTDIDQSGGTLLNPAVTFVTRYFGRARGGIGRYEEALLPHLTRYCRVYQQPIEPWPLPSFVNKVGRAVGRDFSAVMANHPFYLMNPNSKSLLHFSNQTLAGNILWQRHRSGTVVTVHDIIPILASNSNRGDWSWPESKADFVERLFTFQWTLGIKRADGVIVDSSVTRDDLVRYLGIPYERIQVVPLAVDHGLFHDQVNPADDRELLAQLGLENLSATVLYVGSQHPRKNLRVLLQAFARVRSVVSTARLLIVGAARVDENTAHQVLSPSTLVNLGIAGSVEILGHITEQELASLYRLAAVAVMPSVYEGFGLPVLEAMACGCPTISANASSLPEVVGDAGLLFLPSDSEELARLLLRILQNSNEARRLGELGLARAAKFTWQRTAEETIEVYRAVAQSRAQKLERGQS